MIFEFKTRNLVLLEFCIKNDEIGRRNGHPLRTLVGFERIAAKKGALLHNIEDSAIENQDSSLEK